MCRKRRNHNHYFSIKAMIFSVLIFCLLTKVVSTDLPCTRTESFTQSLGKDSLTLINYLDTSINGVLIIENENSVLSTFGDVSKYLSEKENTAPEVVVLSARKNICLRMTHWYGDKRNQFGFFQIEKYVDKSENHIQSKFEDFVSTNGIKLGMSDEEVKRRVKVDFVTIETAQGFILEYSVPGDLYKCVYSFDKEGVLVKFGFGNTYP